VVHDAQYVVRGQFGVFASGTWLLTRVLKLRLDSLFRFQRVLLGMAGHDRSNSIVLRYDVDI
jgi:hypothetical protein